MSSKHDKPDPNQIPGDTTYLTDKNRPRYLCEYTGYDCSDCEDLTAEFIELKEQIDHWQNKDNERVRWEVKYNTADREHREELHSLEEHTAQLRQNHAAAVDHLINTRREETDKLRATLMVIRKAGQIVAEMALEYGDHTKECDIWQFRQSGRLIDMPEKEICTCNWITCKESILEGKAQADSSSEGLTKEQIEEILGVS